MISVIVVLFFSKHLLSGLIENLKNIIGPHLGEIILVNNNINEDLSPFKNEIVKIINNKDNVGYGAGINIGVKSARYNRLLFINPDIKLYRFDFFINPDSLILAGGFNNEMPYGSNFPPLFRDTFRITLKRIFPFKTFNFILDVPHSKIIDDIQFVDYFSGSLIITNQKTFNLLKGFDDKYFLFYEEIDLCKRASINNVPVFITKSIEYSHKIIASSSSNNVSVFKTKCELASFFIYHNKYSDRLVILLSKIFITLFTLIYYPVFTLLSLITKNKYFKSRKKLFAAYYNFLFKKDR